MRVSVLSVARIEELLARARGLDPSRVDIAAAVALAALGVAMLAGPRQPTVAALACGVLGAGTVATRRRAPVASAAVVAGATILLARADPGVDQPFNAVAAALCFYTLGRTGGARATPLIDVALVAVGVAAVAATPQHTAVDIAATWMLFVLAPYASGRTVESRSMITRKLRANAELARREQEARARSAAAEERTRIARELHDVIAHSVSVMVIQTAAAREVAAEDRDAARAALRAVQLSGREALAEMRRMIGVLRRGDVDLAGTAAPGLGQLDLLAQRARVAGLPVDLAVHGHRRALPQALDLVAFRVVQEALTNSIKHAGRARASVTVTFSQHSLELEICDDGCGAPVLVRPANGGGHGLLGMRERLTLFGGELSTGRRPGGGFRVYAQLPVDEAVAA